MRKIISLSVLIVLLSVCCNNTQRSGTEKTQKKRNNVINVSDKIVDIKSENHFGNALLYLIGDVLIVDEKNPKGDKEIHLFNKNTFKYITSTGMLGRGPGEIISSGHLGIDRINKVFWVPDHGNKVIYKFPLDSILNKKMFKPTVKKTMDNELSIARFGFLNDSIILGKAVHLYPNSSFDMKMVKLNIKTNDLGKFGYENPKIVGRETNSYFNISIKNKIYVNAYSNVDLITICDLDGNLKWNIYGPGWYDKMNKTKNYFGDIDFCNENIIISYLGDEGIVTKGNITRGASPSKLLIFDLEGNYLKTIETGSEIGGFCVDEENHRIIVCFDDREEPLGYFDIP